MKKFLVLVVALFIGLVNVNAMTEAELKEKLYDTYTVNGATFKATDQERELIARYLDQYDVSSNDADYVYAQLQAAFDVLRNSGKTRFQDMTQAQKQQVVNIVAAVDENTDFDCAIVDAQFVVYQPDTQRSEEYYETPVYPIAQTNGNLVVCGLGIISLIGMALAVKKIKNA